MTYDHKEHRARQQNERVSCLPPDSEEHEEHDYESGCAALDSENALLVSGPRGGRHVWCVGGSMHGERLRLHAVIVG